MKLPVFDHLLTNPLYLVASLLAITPILIALLQLVVGLTMRADFLLGRLDTVRDLCQKEIDGMKGKNLWCQVIECIHHVLGFSSYLKKRELQRVHGTLHGAVEYPGTPTEGAASLHKIPSVVESLYGTSGRFPRITHILDGFSNYVRYLLPALFLCALYGLGFFIILLHGCENLPFCPNAVVCPAPPAPSTSQVSTSSTNHIDNAAGGSSLDQAKEQSQQDANSASDHSIANPQPVSEEEARNKIKLEDQRSKTEKDKQDREDLFQCLMFAFMGAFVFNIGIMVRRLFVWDISGQMFWSASYGVVLSLGLTVVLHYTTDKLDARLYFLIPMISVSILDSLTRNLRSKLAQSEAVPKQSELSLQLIQGIDFWKEQRLMEEGIESIQHLATADFVLLALHMRSPLYTIMDWVDQAIFIQRFPGKLDKMKDAGFPVSAVELTWGCSKSQASDEGSAKEATSEGGAGNQAGAEADAYMKDLSEVTGIKPEVMQRTLDAWKNDNQVQLLTLFWRADLGTASDNCGPKKTGTQTGS